MIFPRSRFSPYNFPQWMKYVLDVIPHKFAQFAEKIEEIPRAHKSDRERGSRKLKKSRVVREIGAPVTLREVGISEGKNTKNG